MRRALNKCEVLARYENAVDRWPRTFGYLDRGDADTACSGQHEHPLVYTIVISHEETPGKSVQTLRYPLTWLQLGTSHERLVTRRVRHI